jgi:hypothetical protein
MSAPMPAMASAINRNGSSMVSYNEYFLLSKNIHMFFVAVLSGR